MISVRPIEERDHAACLAVAGTLTEVNAAHQLGLKDGERIRDRGAPEPTEE